VAELPTNDEIIGALDAAGFLLEQKVAVALDGAGFAVRVAASYLDPDEGKSREIDVIGVKEIVGPRSDECRAFHVVPIECKSTPMPYVAFLRDWHQRDRENLPWEVVLNGLPRIGMDGGGEPWITLGLQVEWETHRINVAARGEQLVRVERKGSKFAARNVLLEVGMPAIKAAHDLRRVYGGSGNVILFPAAVVSGTVFSISSEDIENPELVERDFVTVACEVSSNWMTHGYRRNHFDIVAYDRLTRWLEHMNNVTYRIGACLP